MRNLFVLPCLILPLWINAQTRIYDDSINVAYKDANYRKVIQFSRTIDELDSLNWGSCYQVGLSYMQEYNFSKAIGYLEMANDKNPKDHNILRSLSRCYETIGDNKSAIGKYKLSLQFDSTQLTSRMQLALLLEDIGQYNQAYNHYLQLVKEDSTNFYFTRQVARCSKKMDSIDVAVTWYKRTIQLNPKDISSAIQLINFLIGQGELDSSEHYSDMAYIQDTSNVRIIKQKAYIKYLKKEHEQAIEWFRKALSYNDSTKFLCKYLGMANYKSSYYDSAIVYLSKAYKLDTLDVEVAFFIGNAFGKLLQEEMALAYLEKAKNIIMPSKDLMISIYGKMGEMHNAIDEYNLALVDYLTPHGFYPDEPELLFYIAIQYDYMTNYKKALRYYERFLSVANSSYDKEVPDGLNISFNAYARERARIIKEELFFEGETE